MTKRTKYVAPVVTWIIDGSKSVDRANKAIVLHLDRALIYWPTLQTISSNIFLLEQIRTKCLVLFSPFWQPPPQGLLAFQCSGDPGDEGDPGTVKTVKDSQFCRKGAPKVLNEWKKEALPYISPCLNTFVALFLLTQLTSPSPSRIDASTEPMNPSPELIKIIRVIPNH